MHYAFGICIIFSIPQMTILDSNVYNQSYKFNVQLIMIICKFSANYLQLPTGLVLRFDLSMS